MKFAVSVLGSTALAESRPARGAWVEIMLANGKPSMRVVAPRKGRVG